MYRKGALPAFSRPLRSSTGRIVTSAGLTALGLIGFSQLAPKLQVPVEINTSSSSQETIDTRATEVEPKKEGSAGFFKPKCPMDFKPVDMPEDGVYGMKRVSRNPNFWSLGLLGAGVAAASSTAPQVVAFGFPLVFALFGGAHQDSRFRRGMGGVLEPEVDAKTSNVPFLALVTGHQQWADLKDEVKWTNAALATLVAFLYVLKKAR